jgi:hypothetical protein
MNTRAYPVGALDGTRQAPAALSAAKRVESVGSDASAILVPGMIPSENFVVCDPCASERLRARGRKGPGEGGMGLVRAGGF